MFDVRVFPSRRARPWGFLPTGRVIQLDHSYPFRPGRLSTPICFLPSGWGIELDLSYPSGPGRQVFWTPICDALWMRLGWCRPRLMLARGSSSGAIGIGIVGNEGRFAANPFEQVV